MEEFRFFKTTPTYKELMIFSEIAKNPSITQKKIAQTCQITAPMVNEYLTDLKAEGYIEIRGTSTRNTTYHLTESGRHRFMILNISYNREVVRMYKDAEKTFESVWSFLILQNLKRIILFGAGDIGEMALEVMEGHGIEIMGFIDEDLKRIGNELHGMKIYSIDKISNLDFDAIIVASYRHAIRMAERVISQTDKPVYIFALENGTTSLQHVENKNLKGRKVE